MDVWVNQLNGEVCSNKVCETCTITFLGVATFCTRGQWSDIIYLTCYSTLLYLSLEQPFIGPQLQNLIICIEKCLQ